MFGKLFASILDSSVWLEAPATRLVWLTLLAAKDQDGFARFATPENLAIRARVPLPECEEALRILEGPDPDSSNQDHEGRRLERVPGGWVVINAKLYDMLASRAEEREQNRLRVQKHRAKATGAAPTEQSEPITVSHGNHRKPTPEAEAVEAFTSLRSLLEQVGDLKHMPAETITSLPPRVRSALKAVGGHAVLKRCEAGKLVWLQKDFVKHYLASND